MNKNERGEVQLYVDIPGEVHRRLLAVGRKQNTAVSDLVLMALSREFGIRADPKGYPFRASRHTGDGKRTFWIPPKLKDALAHRAVDEHRPQAAVFTDIMRRTYGPARRTVAA